MEDSWWCLVGRIPDEHQAVRASGRQLGTGRVPGDIIQRDRIPSHDPHTLPPFHIPHTYGPIFTATEESTALGCEGKCIDDSGMSMERCSVRALFHIPEPDDLVKASTGDRASIRTPGHRMHSFRMSPSASEAGVHWPHPRA